MRLSQPKDDRSQPCRLAPLTARQIGWRALGLRSVTPDPAIKQEMRQTVVLENSIALAGGVVGAVFYKFVLKQLVSKWVGSLGSIVVMVIVAIITAMLVWWLALGRIRITRSSRIHDIYLAMGQCGSCGYALADLRPTDDGFLNCPECNAAWRVDRVGTPTDKDAPPSS